MVWVELEQQSVCNVTVLKLAPFLVCVVINLLSVRQFLVLAVRRLIPGLFFNAHPVLVQYRNFIMSQWGLQVRYISHDDLPKFRILISVQPCKVH